MSTAYTNLLGFALPVTGELNGTWGDVVNNSITELVEDSIASAATTSVASGDWTLTTTGGGVTNQARCAILIPTGSPGVSRNIIAPSQSKAYIVVNQSDAAVVLKGSATTGVSIPAGVQALCAWNGSDFVSVGVLTFSGGTTGLTPSSGTSGNITLGGTLVAANGGTGQSSYTTGDLLYASSSSALSKLADVATGNALISGGVSASPSWGKVGLTTHVSGTLPVANGGTGMSTIAALSIPVANTLDTYTTVTPSAGQSVRVNSGGTAWEAFTPASGGTVTSVSVVSANGLAGTVANATTTPAITLSTSITGMLKGNGTAISAGTANTDYLVPALANTAVTGFKTATFNSQTTIATTSGSITVDWTTAQNQKQTEPTGTITYTFTAPPGPCHLQLLIDSDGTSTAQTVNWPGSVVWINSTWSGTNNKKAVINFWYDGTSYYAIGANQA